MSKRSFAVGYRIERKNYVVLGVTSIVPNMNGILMFTEDGNNHSIEQYELCAGDLLPNAWISYEDADSFTDLDGYTIIDHREV